ncbi:hypothetical protein BTA51_23430 [Hahella sp. CCB-MM4]|uniref:hypothetical protein n=1 Tax=Hahella sp. (strain CCB-MM4) TaxID=1926491 RepID=UPI000B9B358C|nr:hypothetical protein [Hahella sp. CCB-MM4]OZG71056.1 hypothetical protein BTA51_23430 [Hahella sp. CCB-MM4]
MKIKESSLPADVLEKIKNPDPIEGEDILIENESGELVGVIIQPKAYEFFLKKIEEKEDEMDGALDEKYDSSAKSLDDLMGED